MPHARTRRTPGVLRQATSSLCTVRAGSGSVVRENIWKLVNEGGGIVLGDRRILEHLMTDPQGSPGWRMGPTYSS